MKSARVVLFIIIAIAIVAPVVTAGEGAVEGGKKLFENPSFAGGVKSCNNSRCHPEGRGIRDAGKKSNFTIFGIKAKSLEEAVNVCIEGANKGKAIPKDSQEMKDIVAYIKSLGKEETSGYGAPGYK